MTSTSGQRRTYGGAALFSHGFRPFFLGGALVAATVPMATALSLSGALSVGAAYGPIAYHGHEMVFGYLAAVVSGFVLTAVPNWTGRLPVVGRRLIALFGLWIAGRLALPFSGTFGAGVAAVIDAPFLFVMALVMWREVSAGKNWRNAPVCVLVTVLAMANLLWHLDALGNGAGTLDLRAGMAVISVLIALIGGRITPSFTRNWLVKTGRSTLNASTGPLDRTALGVLIAALSVWLVAPQHTITGVLLFLAAALHLLRLSRWRGWRTAAEPLVSILHIGYLWLPVGLVFLGISAIDPLSVTPSLALHALTAGAAGVMPLAVMTRATLGHTGRELRADAPTVAIYLLINLGAVARLAAGFMPAYYVSAVTVAALLWSGAFLLFAAVYGRYLAAPRPSARPQAA